MIINCGALLTGAALTLRSTDGALLTASRIERPRPRTETGPEDNNTAGVEYAVIADIVSDNLSLVVH